MTKNVALSTLAFTAAILICVPLTACGAGNKLSEAEAWPRWPRPPLVKKWSGPTVRNLKVSGCRDFESISERGVAKITLSYTVESLNEYQQTWHILTGKTISDTCHFIRTDQGWKVEACR